MLAALDKHDELAMHIAATRQTGVTLDELKEKFLQVAVRRRAASEMMVAAARAAGALQSTMYAAAVQEHERATHGWQLEWLVLPQLVALASGSASHGVFVVRHLRVDVARMRETIGDAGNVVMAESLALALADRLPLEEAQALVKRASAELHGADEPLVAVVRRAALARGIDSGLDWDRLASPSAHPGATSEIIDRIVDEAKRTLFTNPSVPPDPLDSRHQRR